LENTPPPWKVYPPKIFHGEFLLLIILPMEIFPVENLPPFKKIPKRIPTLLKTSP
jgi:hypothetical protein